MEKFEILKYFENFKTRILDLVRVIDIDKIKSQIASYEKVMLEDNFWSDTKNASSVIKNTNKLKDDLSKINKFQELLDEFELSIDLEVDHLEIENLIKVIEEDLDKFEISQLLNGEYDNSNAIMELHPGAGGTESQDWALMLYRMYKRFSERAGFEFELIDYQEASDAGLKSVTFMLKGTNAYGYLSSEKGVHRLVRISPLDRYVSTLISSSKTSISILLLISGVTLHATKLVCLLAFESNGEILTKRWTPFSLDK